MVKQDVQQVTADEELLDLSKRLAEARTAAKQWGEIADVTRDELMAHCDELAEDVGEDAVIMSSNGVKIGTVSMVLRKTVDMDRLKAAYPDIPYDEFMKVSASRQVRIS